MEIDAFLHGDRSAPCDGSQREHTRLHPEDLALLGGVCFDLGRQRRARPDNAHLSLEDVEYLGQFVKSVITKKTANRCDPGFLRLGPGGRRGVRGASHGPELDESK